MGNDGGSIPTRRELVKNAARNPNTSEVKATQLESQTHAWTFCPLSQRLLSIPIVSDCAGNLYNKDAVLEYLLPSEDPAPSSSKTEHEEELAGRIKSLRDVVEVKFETSYDETTKREKRICPVTSKELGPHTKAVYIVPCGHAFSEAAVKEVASDVCLQCNEPFKPENLIPILPLAKEDVARLAERIKKLKDTGLTHSLKKAPGSKKRKKDIESSEIVGKIAQTDGQIKNENIESDIRSGLWAAKGLSAPQSRSGTATPSGGIQNAATASLTARVLDEQEMRNKRRKLGLNDNLKSLFTSNGPKAKQNGADFMTRGFSIPKGA